MISDLIVIQNILTSWFDSMITCHK